MLAFYIYKRKCLLGSFKMSIYDTIVSAMKTEYPELENLSRNEFYNMIYHRSFDNTLFWLNNKKYFIGSTTTFENVQINDSSNYPFKSIGDDEHVFGGMMASYQQLGAAGEYKCNELLYTSGDISY